MSLSGSVCGADCAEQLIGLHEVRACSTVWRQLGAEFVGTYVLVLIGCGSTTSEGHEPDTVQVALAFGLTVACVVQCIGHVSGGHVNPAVTAGMLASGHVSLPRAVLYLAAQCAGSIAGAAALQALTPPGTASTLGATTVSRHLMPLQAFFVEALITFVLVTTAHGVCFAGHPEGTGGVPFTIGLSVTACHLFAMQYTGASMNPARTLGPAVIHGSWNNHWVYWAGPAVGGIAAGLVFHPVHTRNTS